MPADPVADTGPDPVSSNVKAARDVRLLTDQDPAALLQMVNTAIDDPAIEAARVARDTRPDAPPARLDSEVFRAIASTLSRLGNTIQHGPGQRS